MSQSLSHCQYRGPKELQRASLNVISMNCRALSKNTTCKTSQKEFTTLTKKAYVLSTSLPTLLPQKIKAQAITSPRSSTVTVIGAGNALGCPIPPFYVFPGKRVNNDLLTGCSPGSSGTVSATGWSNSDIFYDYMTTHFIRYMTYPQEGDYTLVLYDGHKSHISLRVIQWAREKNIILFVLPPHCSHLLQPMDVGCYRPFSIAFSKECQSFMQAHPRQVITKFDIGSLGSKAYVQSMTAGNLQAAFKVAGIYPLDRSVIAPSDTAPSLVFQPQGTPSVPSSSQSQSQSFFKQRSSALQPEESVVHPLRRNISHVVGGKPITEDSTYKDILNYRAESAVPRTAKRSEVRKEDEMCNRKCDTRKGKGKKRPAKNKKKGPMKKQKETQKINTGGMAEEARDDPDQSISEEPRPGPSGLQRPLNNDSSDGISDAEDEVCCICHKFSPPQLRNCVSLVIVKWAQCDIRNHWTHLGFCSNVRVVRQSGHFFCPHCERQEE